MSTGLRRGDEAGSGKEKGRERKGSFVVRFELVEGVGNGLLLSSIEVTDKLFLVLVSTGRRRSLLLSICSET